MDKRQTAAQERARQLFSNERKSDGKQIGLQEYEAAQEATRRKTARLRAERLARAAEGTTA
jgi:hypothetical protein